MAHYVEINSIEEMQKLLPQYNEIDQDSLLDLQDIAKEAQGFIDLELGFNFDGREVRLRIIRNWDGRYLELPPCERSSVTSVSILGKHMTSTVKLTEQRRRYDLMSEAERSSAGISHWSEVPVDDDDEFFVDVGLLSMVDVEPPSDALILPLQVDVIEGAESDKERVWLECRDWGNFGRKVRVTANWGYGDPPAVLVKVVKELIVAFWLGRASGGSNVIAVSGEAGGVAVGYASYMTSRQKRIIKLIKTRWEEPQVQMILLPPEISI